MGTTSVECPICLEDPGLQWGGLRGCLHKFCLLCIETWAESSTACPMCRTPFNHIDVFGGRINEKTLLRTIDVEPRQFTADADVEPELDDNVRNAACEICQSSENEAELLLCDGILNDGSVCPKACHMLCAGLDQLPPIDAEWFCLECAGRQSGDSTHHAVTYSPVSDDEARHEFRSSVREHRGEIVDRNGYVNDGWVVSDEEVEYSSGDSESDDNASDHHSDSGSGSGSGSGSEEATDSASDSEDSASDTTGGNTSRYGRALRIGPRVTSTHFSARESGPTIRGASAKSDNTTTGRTRRRILSDSDDESQDSPESSRVAQLSALLQERWRNLPPEERASRSKPKPKPKPKANTQRKPRKRKATRRTTKTGTKRKRRRRTKASEPTSRVIEKKSTRLGLDLRSFAHSGANANGYTTTARAQRMASSFKEQSRKAEREHQDRLDSAVKRERDEGSRPVQARGFFARLDRRSSDVGLGVRNGGVHVGERTNGTGGPTQNSASAMQWTGAPANRTTRQAKVVKSTTAVNKKLAELREHTRNEGTVKTEYDGVKREYPGDLSYHGNGGGNQAEHGQIKQEPSVGSLKRTNLSTTAKSGRSSVSNKRGRFDSLEKFGFVTDATKTAGRSATNLTADSSRSGGTTNTHKPTLTNLTADSTRNGVTKTYKPTLTTLTADSKRYGATATTHKSTAASGSTSRSGTSCSTTDNASYPYAPSWATTSSRQGVGGLYKVPKRIPGNTLRYNTAVMGKPHSDTGDKGKGERVAEKVGTVKQFGKAFVGHQRTDGVESDRPLSDQLERALQAQKRPARASNTLASHQPRTTKVSSVLSDNQRGAAFVSNTRSENQQHPYRAEGTVSVNQQPRPKAFGTQSENQPRTTRVSSTHFKSGQQANKNYESLTEDQQRRRRMEEWMRMKLQTD